MRRFASSTLGLLALALLPGLLFTSSFRAETKSPATTGKTVKPFTLKDSAGKPWSLADARGSKAVVVVFLGTECPINNQYAVRLAELHKTYSPKVAFVGVNSNVHDTPTRIAAHVKANAIPFPVLKDSGNVVADDFGARRTPEAFVLSPAGKILYQGRIDDQFGVGFKRKEATRRDLALALDEVLAGKEVTTPLTAPPGCLIARAVKPADKGSITYNKHIRPILQNRCQECHRTGQVGPMPLIDLRGRSFLVRDDPRGRGREAHAALARRPEARRFQQRPQSDEGRTRGGPGLGEAGLSPGRRQRCRPGEEVGRGLDHRQARRRLRDASRVHRPGQQQGGRPLPVFPRQHQLPGGSLDSGRRVPGRCARSGASHHRLCHGPARRAGRGGDRRDGIGNGFLAAYAPGDMPLRLSPGYAKKLPKGAMLVFQMHYTPDGVERKDRSSVGLIFAKQPPKSEVRTRAIAQQAFWILPGQKNHQVVSRTTFDKDVELLSLLPHMHLRGKDFKYDVTYPDGKKETLLSVPKYDFNWQSNYRLKTPLRLPAGTRIDCTAHFDNSSDNPNNPDPKKLVLWGDQTWEEMMIGFVDYAVRID